MAGDDDVAPLMGDAAPQSRLRRTLSCLKRLVGLVFSKTGRDVVRELVPVIVTLSILGILQG